MKTSRFICCCAIVVIVSTAVGSTFADQSTKERIRIHKEWLARRAASRVNTNSTQRTTYLRKLIKFKNEHEPLSENDISFVPHFAHNNRDNEYHQEGGGGSGGTEGTRGDTVESRGELQQDSDNEYGLRPVGSVANPDDMSEQQSQADRYRYNVATGESNLPRPADGSVQSRLLVHHPEDGPEASNEIPLVTSTGGSSGASGVTQQRNDATVTSGGRGNESETPTERINAVAKINEPGRSGTVHGMNNDLQPLQVGATGSGTHKSDPGRAVVGDKRKSWHHSTIINNETTDDENSTSSYGGRAGFATTTGATPTTTAISKVALEGAKVDDHDRTKVDGNVTVRNGFGPWSNWTACSRSCGGGVKSQQRKCWRREYINGKKSPKPAVESHDCIGIVKRYHLCNEQDCPDTTVDFREQQCTSFNNQTFQDKRYIWEAFIKDDAECELNCKPIGMRYFATLNKTVIDGTPCRKPTEYFRRNNSGRGICVDGICKVILIIK